MISILNGDKTMANVILVTTSTVVTTEATSSAVRVGWPRGATKLASMSLATKNQADKSEKPE